MPSNRRRSDRAPRQRPPSPNDSDHPIQPDEISEPGSNGAPSTHHYPNRPSSPPRRDAPDRDSDSDSSNNSSDYDPKPYTGPPFRAPGGRYVGPGVYDPYRVPGPYGANRYDPYGVPGPYGAHRYDSYGVHDPYEVPGPYGVYGPFDELDPRSVVMYDAYHDVYHDIFPPYPRTSGRGHGDYRRFPPGYF